MSPQQTEQGTYSLELLTQNGDFAGGVNELEIIGKNESPKAWNIYTDDSGTLRPRPKFEYISTAADSVASANIPNVRRAFSFTSADGAEQLIITDNTNVWASTDMKTFTKLKNGAGVAIAFDPTHELKFSALNYNLWMTNGYNDITKWDGTTATTITTFTDTGLTCADAEAKHIITWNGCIFLLNCNAGGNVVYYTEPTGILNSTNQLQFKSSKAGSITGAAVSKQGLVVFMTSAEMLLTGYSAETFQITEIGQDGSVNGDSVCDIDGTIMYLSQPGFKVTDGVRCSKILNKMPDKIKNMAQYYSYQRKSIALSKLNNTFTNYASSIASLYVPNPDDNASVDGSWVYWNIIGKQFQETPITTTAAEDVWTKTDNGSASAAQWTSSVNTTLHTMEGVHNRSVDGFRAVTKITMEILRFDSAGDSTTLYESEEKLAGYYGTNESIYSAKSGNLTISHTASNKMRRVKMRVRYYTAENDTALGFYPSTEQITTEFLSGEFCLPESTQTFSCAWAYIVAGSLGTYRTTIQSFQKAVFKNMTYTTNSIPLGSVLKWASYMFNCDYLDTDYITTITMQFSVNGSAWTAGSNNLYVEYYKKSDNSLTVSTSNTISSIDPNYVVGTGLTTSAYVKFTVFIEHHDGSGVASPSTVSNFPPQMQLLQFSWLYSNKTTTVVYHNMSSINWKDKYILTYCKLGEQYNNYMIMLDNFLTENPRYYPWRFPYGAFWIKYGGDLILIYGTGTLTKIYKFESGTVFDSTELPVYYETGDIQLPEGILKHIRSVDIVTQALNDTPEFYMSGSWKNIIMELWIDGRYAGTFDNNQYSANGQCISHNSLMKYTAGVFETCNEVDVKIRSTSSGTYTSVGWGNRIRVKLYWKPVASSLYPAGDYTLDFLKIVAIRFNIRPVKTYNRTDYEIRQGEW